MELSSIPHYAFMAWCSVERSSGAILAFTFTLVACWLFNEAASAANVTYLRMIHEVAVAR
jgi:hypothetical protein